MNYDIGIIGGGVIGLSCAWRLAQGGARVALFERGEIGREASYAAAGMLAAQCEMAHHPPQVDGDDDASTRAAAMFKLCLQSRALYPDFAEELREATGHDIELDLRGARSWLRPLGITYIAKNANDIAISAFEAQRERGLCVACIDGSIRQWLPGIGDFQRAFYLADEGAVDNRKLVAALHEAATRAGVSIHENTEVRGVQSDNFGARINAVQETFACEKVLLCAGAWSGQLPTPLAPLLRGVQPIGGQMICLQHDLGTVLYSSDVYLVPRRDGRLLVGATIEAPGFRGQNRGDATVAGTRKLLRAACELLPELKDAPLLNSWAGLRPGTPDGLPILGKTPIKNLFIATGHFRNGILLAPQTAHIMARCLLKNEDAPQVFSVERFQPCT